MRSLNSAKLRRGCSNDLRGLRPQFIYAVNVALRNIRRATVSVRLDSAAPWVTISWLVQTSPKVHNNDQLVVHALHASHNFSVIFILANALFLCRTHVRRLNGIETWRHF